RFEVVAEQENSNGFPSYPWNQFALDRLFRHQTHRPTGTALRGTAADHCNQTLLLAVVEHFGGPGSLSFVQRPLQPALLVTTANIAYGLGSEWDHVGDPRCTGALPQLQQSQGP